jgi:hypothetical protein
VLALRVYLFVFSKWLIVSGLFIQLVLVVVKLRLRTWMQRDEGVRTTSRLLSHFTVEYHLLIGQTFVSPRTRPNKPLAAYQSTARRVASGLYTFICYCKMCFHYRLALYSSGHFLILSSPPGFTGFTALAHKFHRSVA